MSRIHLRDESTEWGILYLNNTVLGILLMTFPEIRVSMPPVHEVGVRKEGEGRGGKGACHETDVKRCTQSNVYKGIPQSAYRPTRITLINFHVSQATVIPDSDSFQ